MNKTIKKLTIAVVALSLILLGVVGGVAAWLVAETQTVTNTFTYGNVSISLTESTNSSKGEVQKDQDEKLTGIHFENVVPGDKLNKEVTVTVDATSEKCYVYVLIKNDLGTAASYNISVAPAQNAQWENLGTSDKGTLYRYIGATDNVVSASTSMTVFTTLTFQGEQLDAAALEALRDKTIVIQAYAHQADNTDQTTADKAAKIWAGITTQNNG